MFCYLQMNGACGDGARDYVIDATAKVKIRRGSFEVSSQVNAACSCSERLRQAAREAS